MKAPFINAKDRELDAWTRDITAMLTVGADGRGGLRFADQIGPVVTFIWNDARAPLAVHTPLITAPLSVIVLDATTGNGSHTSCVPIAWSWTKAGLRIDGIAGIASSTDYTVAIGLVR